MSWKLKTKYEYNIGPAATCVRMYARTSAHGIINPIECLLYAHVQSLDIWSHNVLHRMLAS